MLRLERDARNTEAPTTGSMIRARRRAAVSSLQRAMSALAIATIIIALPHALGRHTRAPNARGGRPRAPVNHAGLVQVLQVTAPAICRPVQLLEKAARSMHGLRARKTPFCRSAVGSRRLARAKSRRACR